MHAWFWRVSNTILRIYSALCACLQPFVGFRIYLHDLVYGLKFLGVVLSDAIALIDRLLLDSLVNGRLGAKKTRTATDGTGAFQTRTKCHVRSAAGAQLQQFRTTTRSVSVMWPDDVQAFKVPLYALAAVFINRKTFVERKGGCLSESEMASASAAAWTWLMRRSWSS